MSLSPWQSEAARKTHFEKLKDDLEVPSVPSEPTHA